MYYSISHLTRFQYDAPVNESMMELRMHPRTDQVQRSISFNLQVSPRSRVQQYYDYQGNIVHHFNVPGRHLELRILTEAVVELDPPSGLPDTLSADSWQQLDQEVAQGDFWEELGPSQFAKPTPGLLSLIEPLKVHRRADPLTFMRELNAAMYAHFTYTPKHTRVDSPIDEAIESRKGVCQDFSHIMIALARQVRIPCRYVSGYVHHRRSDHSPEGATHAWVEAFLPTLGWVAFDPTNNVLPGDRHIKTAIGRDYADVPPTKGIFNGDSSGRLTVSVRVVPADSPLPPTHDFSTATDEWQTAALAAAEKAEQEAQQQQQ